MRFGIDRAAAERTRWLRGGRVGLVTNDAARLAADPRRLSRVALLETGVELVRLFSPEHGLSASEADGQAVADGHDPATGLPVVSLYGPRLQPRAQELMDLDTILFDVQDTGVRFYTYLWSLFHLMETAAELHRPVVVLDRPNLLGGNLSLVEGPILDVDTCGSFLGRCAMPIRYSLTIGELARLWQAKHFPHLQLDVVPLDGWDRRCDGARAGLTLVPPSPALTSWDALFLYPGLCLFEATNLSVGRGSEYSFRGIGSPWLEPDPLLEWLERQPDLTEIGAKAVEFAPRTENWADRICRGVRFSPAAAARHKPVSFGLRLLAYVAAAYADCFEWRPYPTAANPTGARHLERLLGRDEPAAMLRASPDRVDLATIRRWTSATGWTERAEPFILYGTDRGPGHDHHPPTRQGDDSDGRRR